MTASRSEQMALFERHEALLTLAMTEYLLNVVFDFCPVERRLLVRLDQGRFVINHMCDAFRAQLDECEGGSEEATRIAAQTLSSIQRSLKTCNRRPAQWSAHSFSSSSSSVHRNSSGGGGTHPTTGVQRSSSGTARVRIQHDDLMAALELPVVSASAGSVVSQIHLLRPDLPYTRLEAVEAVWESFAVHTLPLQLLRLQERVLEARASCALYQAALVRRCICLRCALGTRPRVLEHLCSHDCVTGALRCKACGFDMIPVHLLGRLLRVRDVFYVLCTGCLTPMVWRADCPVPHRCPGCYPYRHNGEGGRQTAAAASAPRKPDHCVACMTRVIAHLRPIVDWRRLRMVRVPLCHRHSCLSRTAIHDPWSLRADLRLIPTRNPKRIRV